MDPQPSQPPNNSPLGQQQWMKIALGIAVLVLLAWLNSFNTAPVDPHGKAAADHPANSAPASSGDRQQTRSDSADGESEHRSDTGSATADANPDGNFDSKSSAEQNRGGDRSLVVRNVRVTNEDGEVVYRGDVDLQPTLARIEQGQRLRFSHDGIVFENREGRLPRKSDGYYHEYVQPTPHERGPGSQRVVLGDGGEVYYSSDHYRTFQRLR